jgi:hypothetical protein
MKNLIIRITDAAMYIVLFLSAVVGYMAFGIAGALIGSLSGILISSAWFVLSSVATDLNAIRKALEGRK